MTIFWTLDDLCDLGKAFKALKAPKELETRPYRNGAPRRHKVDVPLGLGPRRRQQDLRLDLFGQAPLRGKLGPQHVPRGNVITITYENEMRNIFILSFST